VFELLVADDVIRAMIHRGDSEANIRAQALQIGMTLMHDDAQRLIDAGVTSAAEVARVTRD
jgi:general secretion pathway protein E